MDGDVSEAERLLRAAFPVGEWVDLRAGNPSEDDLAGAAGWGADRTIRAEILAGLLLGAGKSSPGHFPAVRLRGARIAGLLDVAGAALNCTVTCEFCYFDTTPAFREATTRSVHLTGSRLAGFDGTRMRVEGVFDLSRTEIETVLRMDRATINADLLLRETSVGAVGGEDAVAARGLIVDGELDATQMLSRGPVKLPDARISGSVLLASAAISTQQSPAFNAANTVIGGGFDGHEMSVNGGIRLRHTRVAGSLDLAAAQLANAGGVALGGGGLIVDGGLFCHRGFSAVGEIRLVGARLGAHLDLSDARLANTDGIALNLDRAVLADIKAHSLEVSAGSVSLLGAQLSGRLDMTGAQLSNPGKIALDASGVSTDRRFILDRAQVSGEVRMSTTHVGSRLLLRGAQFDNPGGTALLLSPVEVAADMFCASMRVTGRTDLTGARIGRHLDLSGTHLINPGGTAFAGRALHATELSLTPAVPVQGTVDLSHARIGVLRDDPQRWPDDLRLAGLTYDVLEPQLPALRRLDWLRRGPDSSSPDPYEQLAAFYSRMGQGAEARRVLYAAERHDRSSKPWTSRAWSLLQDVTVGYGYRPFRAGLWLLALLIIGSIVYAAVPPAPLNGNTAPHFNPVIYTLDLLLPVVDLGQKHAYNPAGIEQWLSYLLTAAGWILATTVAAGVARIITRR
jgi:uncharacterized protein YjbI with pentapeptide repeats